VGRLSVEQGRKWIMIHLLEGYPHLESYTPVQDRRRAKSYVQVRTGRYQYIPVHASTGFLKKYVLVRTGTYNLQDMNVSHTPRQLIESKLQQRNAPMQEIF
jgi:hypothetical protein